MKKLFQNLGNVSQLLKDNKGQFSSKRTVALGIVALATADFTSTGQLNVFQVVLCTVAGAIVVLGSKVESSVSKKKQP